MLTIDALTNLSSIKFTLGEISSLPLKYRVAFLDVLYFLSLKQDVVHNATSKDIESFKKLISIVEEDNLDIFQYLASVYPIISSWRDAGHKIPIAYLLNPKVIAEGINKYNVTSQDGLLVSRIKDFILEGERAVLAFRDEYKIPYKDALIKCILLKKVDKIYVLYKHYMALLPNEVTERISEKLLVAYETLVPFFKYISSSSGVYSMRNVQMWSNSKLETFDFCPVLFRDTYLGDVLGKLPDNEAAKTGTLVHSLFEETVLRYKKSKKKDLPSLVKNMKSSKWYSENIKGTEIETTHISGYDTFFSDNGLFQSLVTPESEIHTEFKLEVPVTDPSFSLINTFSGIIDLLVVNGNSAYIIDYKTSKIDSDYWLSVNNTKYKKQVSLYAELLKKLRPEITQVSSSIIYTRGHVHTYFTLDTHIIDTRLQKVLDITKAVKTSQFTPNLKSCKLCQHHKCPHRSQLSMWDEQGNRRNPN